ncbi:Regulator of microtubule dynamics protein 1 [Cichlidogyrus casuarinus]|uniref:Regulator of microtubule dynamics protein 1 n=1 Tax=Cichlidogyrus casuarinus TaxID=1844966 RepID=A0ABD2Q8N7_9PLAT
MKMKANKLRPQDFSTLHSLGVWHYEVSNLSWANVMLAKAFFAAPPTSTFEEALKCLQEAEDLKPSFFASNTVYLANTYYKLKQKEQAKKYCAAALENPNTDLDSMQSKADAQKLMASLK